MPALVKSNMLIAQSGGPTVVINQSLVGATLEAKKHRQIRTILGARFGVKGILAEDFVNLGRESAATLAAVANTPSAALGSVRKKPSSEDCTKIFEVLRTYEVRYFFYIGGNDSAETAHIISTEAAKAGYELNCFHIPKTIDNDLRENDHCPGYGSAARFVALAIMGDNLDSRALPGVKIDVIMGRRAGFLTAAAALAQCYPDDGPHLIYCPERPFDMNRFLDDVKGVYEKLGRCLVAVSEGISDVNKTPIVSAFIKESDSFGNIQLSGTGALGDLLADQVRSKLNISRVRADTFGYLQRSFPTVVSAVDAREARAVGAVAVRTALKQGGSGSIVIRRKPGRGYAVRFECVPLELVARATREMPESFLNAEGNGVTKAFLDYVRPLVGPLPKMARLRGVPLR
ncbi:MAG: 6-phosphofructokinase [Kiritimatiellia bacterium]